MRLSTTAIEVDVVRARQSAGSGASSAADNCAGQRIAADDGAAERADTSANACATQSAFAFTITAARESHEQHGECNNTFHNLPPLFLRRADSAHDQKSNASSHQ
jgi:hypothetical protein